MIRTSQLYDLEHTLAKEYLAEFEYPWQALSGIGELILRLGTGLDDCYREIMPVVWVHESAEIVPSAHIKGPCIIGAGTQVRHGALIRGSVLTGRNCVVGNSTELKNVILFDGVQVPHYNYVGDSILGHCAHMGAGSVTSNLKSDKSPVTIRSCTEIMETGLRKCGAMIGDFAEIGCNAVLNPGTVLGRFCAVYPGSCVRGVIPGNSIFKNDGTVVRKEGR